MTTNGLAELLRLDEQAAVWTGRDYGETPAHWRAKRKRSGTTDNQRAAVYAWENNVVAAFPALAVTLTFDECRALVERVYRDYSKRPPLLKDGRGRRSAAGGADVIALPVWSRTVGVVLHEIAHGLTGVARMHGPQFARLLLDLFAAYGRVPVANARRLGMAQRPRRVHFAETKAVPQRTSTTMLRWQAKRRLLAAALREHDAARPAR